MEARSKRPARVLRRCYQCCRQEAEVLVLAYERICPQVRRVLPTCQPDWKRGRNQRRDKTRRA
jgi:hypothetical protein